MHQVGAGANLIRTEYRTAFSSFYAQPDTKKVTPKLSVQLRYYRNWIFVTGGSTDEKSNQFFKSSRGVSIGR